MRRTIDQIFCVLLLLVTGHAAPAAGEQPSLSVNVLDMDGLPVSEVAILVEPRSGLLRSAHGGQARATLLQQERAFVPHILIVETGTVVEFPNRDQYLHHVYSFSPAKRFEFPLYGGAVAPEIEFDRPGIVTLGCNIHDGMVGYIVVADTPWFGLTDPSGRIDFADLPPGDYQVEVWTPRLRPDRLPEPVIATVGSNPPGRVEIAFRSRLRPPHDESSSTLTWERY